MKYLTSLLFALLIFSCADRTNSRMDENATTPADEMENTMPDRQNPVNDPMNEDMTASPQLESTIQAVESAGGDITALSPSAAVSNIDGWISQLESMDGTSPIVSDLNALKTELTSGNIDGMKVSKLMSSMASKTRDLSSKAPGLSTLASALDAGAQKLSGK